MSEIVDEVRLTRQQSEYLAQCFSHLRELPSVGKRVWEILLWDVGNRKWVPVLSGATYNVAVSYLRAELERQARYLRSDGFRKRLMQRAQEEGTGSVSTQVAREALIAVQAYLAYAPASAG